MKEATQDRTVQHPGTKTALCIVCLCLLALTFLTCPVTADTQAPAPWSIGTPIATYWAGPSLTDDTARQMVEGGFNLVWCHSDQELDVAHRHGLRALLVNRLINPASLEDPNRLEQLDAFIDRVKSHPALYAYHILDEPSAAKFPSLGKLVGHLRQRDPAHLAYINLFPTYANNQQLGTEGDVVTAYKKHLDQYVEQVKPALISYDHYQFRLKSDSDQYFLNLAMIRRTAQDAGVPFLNIVQACTWAPTVMRIPNPDELRYLVYTSLAYGAQGISYYVYAHPNHEGSLVSLDGKPGPLYRAVRSYNPEFVAIATQLQPLRSLGVYHTSMQEPGCEPLPSDTVFHIDCLKEPPSPRGFLLGSFGPQDRPTHVVAVNLDYTAETTVRLTGPAQLDVFDATNSKWNSTEKTAVERVLPPGGGTLVRITK